MIVASCLWRSVVGRHSTLQCVRRGYRSVWASVGCLGSVRRRAPYMYVRSLCRGRVLLNEDKKQNGGEEEIQADKVLKMALDIGYHFVMISLGASFALILFFVVRDIIYPSSPPRIYHRAWKKCWNHREVIETFGGPINDFACLPDGKRIQHISAIQYKRNTVKCLRVTFYISGSKINEATVHVDLKKSSVNWNYDIQYIIVKFGTDPQRSITVEDNRFDR